MQCFSLCLHTSTGAMLPKLPVTYIQSLFFTVAGYNNFSYPLPLAIITIVCRPAPAKVCLNGHLIFIPDHIDKMRHQKHIARHIISIFSLPACMSYKSVICGWVVIISCPVASRDNMLYLQNIAQLIILV